ncbi:NPC1-like intracellular cholesterol transporter 1 [Macrobrachium nipponense]|uniref:NPC1-like intracellular cholesterol transporter 1 n=1 Tax=Macrobrachium nipponense TaxID=159736 RepID=UPI0030C8B7D4
MHVVSLVEKGCGNWGAQVSSHPVKVSCICLLLVSLFSIGLFKINQELRPYRLWISHQSEFAKVNEWKTENFPNEYRQHVALWEAENILTASAIQQIWKLHRKILDISVTVKGETFKWDDICTRVPSLLSNENATQKSQTSDYEYTDRLNITWSPLNWTSYDWLEITNTTDIWNDYDYEEQWANESPTNIYLSAEEAQMMEAVSQNAIQTVQEDYSLVLPRTDYCDLLESKQSICYETSLLEIWGYNNDAIIELTDEKVVKDVNEAFMSNVFGYPTKFDKYLGGIQRGQNNTIIAARATMHTWTTKIQKNKTNVVDLGTGDIVDEGGMAWEMALVEEARSFVAPGIRLHIHAAHSFGKVSAETIKNDIKWVVCGWMVLVIYVLVTLGCPGPAIVGLVCIAVAVAATFGLCSIIGVPYGPINSVLPVLLIALGVDDMYVIVASWKAAGNKDTIKSKARDALRHAGVAVTVTSLTDAVAFLIGATTQVPALCWFCIYAATGVFIVYCLQCTVFVAALAINQKYQDSKKPSCYKLPRITNWSLSGAMKGYATCLVKTPAQVAVIIVATLMLGVGAWGAISLRQEFSPIWFLPRSSYLYNWFTSMNSYFPNDGEPGSVYFSNVSLPDEIPALRKLSADLRDSPYITQVNAWFNIFDVYMLEYRKYTEVNLTSETMYDVLSLFLNSKSGAQFKNHFLFDGNLHCNEPAPQFKAFKIDFTYARLKERSDQQAAMNSIRKIVAAANVSGYHAVWAHVYSQWETDSALAAELWRNLSVVVVVVATMTLLLMAAFRAAFLVLLSVLATLLDVMAIMHICGLTIDTVSCIALVLAIGICVDYSAHVAHAFLNVTGSKKERVQDTIAQVGPAVLHGGTSTLVAFLLLAPADSHLFLSFFQIFTSVSAFGLFHGLVLLPVLLSIIGPEPYPHHLEQCPSLMNVTTKMDKDPNNTCYNKTPADEPLKLKDTKNYQTHRNSTHKTTIAKDVQRALNHKRSKSSSKAMDPEHQFAATTESGNSLQNIKQIAKRLTM